MVYLRMKRGEKPIRNDQFMRKQGERTVRQSLSLNLAPLDPARG